MVPLAPPPPTVCAIHALSIDESGVCAALTDRVVCVDDGTRTLSLPGAFRAIDSRVGEDGRLVCATGINGSVCQRATARVPLAGSGRSVVLTDTSVAVLGA